MRVTILGLRGFPGVQGGIEKHVEQLAPLLRSPKCDVEVIVRTPYMRGQILDEWKGVRFRRIWSPKIRTLEALVHTFLGVFYAAYSRPDILHIQAIGPALTTPVARLLGLRVVVTHHGPDYEREKWGWLAKWILRNGEAMGMRYANSRVVISETIRSMIREKYGVESVLIPNGVTARDPPNSRGALERFNLEAGRYVLLTSRLVPEKRHLDLIQAFVTAKLGGWKLVLVGASDHPDAYAKNILAQANDTPGVVVTGFQTGLTLRELYAHAGLFVLPSSHEGLPIALLEALSYGLPVVASDIPANIEIGLSERHYFPLGDVKALTARLREFAETTWTSEHRVRTCRWVTKRYNWSNAAKNTLDVYNEILGVRRHDSVDSSGSATDRASEKNRTGGVQPQGKI